MENSLFDSLVNAFQAHKSGKRASQMKAYMKGQFEYFGLPSPLRKDLQRSVFENYRSEIKDLNIKDFTLLCWGHPCRELQYAALDLMRKKKKELADESDIPFLEDLVQDKSWWDTVDFLASFHLGNVIVQHLEIRADYLNRWINSPNMWLRRTAILAQLKFKEKTDFDLLTACIIKTAGEKEFFIRKAAGWALREYSKTNPAAVVAFVSENLDILSGLTNREALKWLKNK